MILSLLIGLFISGIFSCHNIYRNLEKDNQQLYKEFKKQQLVDVTGEINLGEVSSKKKNLEIEVKKIFKQENFNKDVYLEKLEEKSNLNTNLKNKITELSNQISVLEEQKSNLTTQYSVLEKKYKQLQQSLAASKVMVDNSNGFPLINQYPNYPTGCESVALTMLLRYYGINIMPASIISNLKKDSLPYYENGIKYGGNPELGFIGNPYSSASYGVYENPIAEVANMYKSGIQVRNNFAFQDVLNLVRNNHPVMVWTSMGLSVPYISDSWIYKPTMETIYWKAGEHAVVIVSYSGGDTLIVADPIGGKLKSYSVSLFEQRYNYFGRKALFYL